MQPLWLFLFTLLVVSAQAQMEPSKSDFFGTANMTNEWKTDARLLELDNVKNPANSGNVSSALKRVEAFSGHPETIRGMIPGILNVISASPDVTQKIEAIQALKATFLKNKAVDEFDIRIAKELAELFNKEKNERVKSKLLQAIAFTGDAKSVQIFVDAAEAYKHTKDETLWESLSEYFHRVGQEKRSVPVPGFKKLEETLRQIPKGEIYAQGAQDLWKRDLASKKNLMENLNVPSVPRASQGHK